MIELNRFQREHLHAFCQQWDPHRGPCDRALHAYFRAHRALGARDRRQIAGVLYDLVRWEPLWDALLGKEASWEERIELSFARPPTFYRAESTLPLHARFACPEPLFSLLEENLSLCHINTLPAPVTVRANRAKISREELLDRWSKTFSVTPCRYAPEGITFQKREPLFSLPEFREGLFEVQDEASQLAASLVQAKPGDQVLDFCAGSGGKALAIAPLLEGQGQLYLHDIRHHALLEARERCKRASVQNYQLVMDRKRLKKAMDWIIVDAPCSGSGTLRRNPDLKKRITKEFVEKMCGLQRTIFEQALSHLKPGGHIVYVTCSVLYAENGEQVRHFLDHYPLELAGLPTQTLPRPEGMDGFFAASFRKKGKNQVYSPQKT